VEHLQHVLAHLCPAAVVYAVQMLASVPALQKTAEVLRAAGIPLGYGGRVFVRFPTLRERIPAFFLGENLTDALENVDALTQISPKIPPAPPAEPALQRAAEALRLHTTRIASRVQERIVSYGVGAEEATFVIRFTHEQGDAALRLGDLTPLHDEMRWAEGWLRARRVDDDALVMLWRLWQEALTDCMGDAAAPILAFLETGK
ncbi:MAG: hypothetical protein ACPL8I_11920, partial [Chloroflexaceae bacterium]